MHKNVIDKSNRSLVGITMQILHWVTFGLTTALNTIPTVFSFYHRKKSLCFANKNKKCLLKRENLLNY